jgi:hypothetical protein
MEKDNLSAATTKKEEERKWRKKKQEGQWRKKNQEGN